MRPTPPLAPNPPTARQYLRAALFWLAIALSTALVVNVLRLAERMGCANTSSRMLHCQHGLLAPETWRRL